MTYADLKSGDAIAHDGVYGHGNCGVFTVAKSMGGPDGRRRIVELILRCGSIIRRYADEEVPTDG